VCVHSSALSTDRLLLCALRVCCCCQVDPLAEAKRRAEEKDALGRAEAKAEGKDSGAHTLP